MLSIRRYPRLLVIGVAYALVAVTGCGSDGGDGDPSPSAGAGAGGDAGQASGDPEGGEPGSDGGRGEGTGGIDASGGTDDGTGGTGDGTAGTTPTGEAGAEGGPPIQAPEFEGVDLDDVELEASPGCDGGFDPETGTITLAVDPSTNTLVVDAASGELRANGWICTAAEGEGVAINDLVRINVTGTGSDDTVILDLLEGDFGSSITEGADSIHIDLGEGADRFVIRGTRGDDEIRCSGEAIDFGGRDGSVTLGGVEGILASLGPGSDGFFGYATATPCSLPVVVYGGDDSDVLQGGAVEDELNGGPGEDEFPMGPKADGPDIVNGGPGEGDLVSYELRNQPLTLALCAASDASGCAGETCECGATNGELDEGDKLVNVEAADGGDASDTITGDERINYLSGKGGADTITGNGGADQIYGDGGDDKIYGGADDDILLGGTGVNTIDGGTGDDLCFMTARDTTVANCETKLQGGGQ